MYLLTFLFVRPHCLLNAVDVTFFFRLIVTVAFGSMHTTLFFIVSVSQIICKINLWQRIFVLFQSWLSCSCILYVCFNIATILLSFSCHDFELIETPFSRIRMHCNNVKFAEVCWNLLSNEHIFKTDKILSFNTKTSVKMCVSSVSMNLVWLEQMVFEPHALAKCIKYKNVNLWFAIWFLDGLDEHTRNNGKWHFHTMLKCSNAHIF